MAKNKSAPVITSPLNVSIPENHKLATPVYQINASDEDGNKLQYWTSGEDNQFFHFDRNSGKVWLDVLPDFEKPLDANHDNIYHIQLHAADSKFDTVEDLYIHVTDVGEAIVATSPPPTSPTPTSPTSTPPASTDATTATSPTTSAPATALDPANIHTEWDLFNNTNAVLRGANIPLIIDQNNPGHMWPDGLPQSTFDQLHSWGANYVNFSTALPTDWNAPFASADYVLKALDTAVAQAAQADMFVCLSFRTGPGRSNDVLNDDGSELNDSIWSDPAAQKAWADALGKVADHFKDNHTVIGYDLMVEPNHDNAAQWNQMAQTFTDAIRAHDTETPIIIPGVNWSYADSLSSLQMPTDPHTAADVHQYAPYEYTHLNAAMPSQSDIQAEYDKMGAFETSTGHPVIVNEFGIKPTAQGDPAQVLQWNFDYLEQHGINNALWDWRETSDTWDQFNLRTMSDQTMVQEVQTYWDHNTIFPSTIHFDLAI